MKRLLAFSVATSIATSNMGMANQLPQQQAKHRPAANQAVSHVVASGCEDITQNTVSVPFTRAESGHIIVDGTFNQRQSKAVVDTGGIGVGGVLSQRFYNSLELAKKSLDEVDVQGAVHANTMQITQLKSAGINNLLAQRLDFVISPKSIISEVDALLGSEFLCSFLVEFDFVNNQLVLHPKSQTIAQKIAAKQAIWGTVDFSDNPIPGAVTLEMMLESKPVVAVLDTGARHSIMNWRAAKLIGIEKGSLRVETEKNSASGIHGNAPKESFKVQLSSLALDDASAVEQKDMTMRIADLGSFKPLVGDKPAINLGVDFFNGRKLLIDYARRQIAISR